MTDGDLPIFESGAILLHLVRAGRGARSCVPGQVWVGSLGREHHGYGCGSRVWAPGGVPGGKAICEGHIAWTACTKHRRPRPALNESHSRHRSHVLVLLFNLQANKYGKLSADELGTAAQW